MTALEVELLKSKQELGEALNTIYDYEQTAADRNLRNPMIFGGSGGNQNNSNNDSLGSGSAGHHNDHSMGLTMNTMMDSQRGVVNT